MNKLNQVFALAEDFRKNRVWKWLLDSEYCAVRFPDGRIGYLRFIGHDSDFPALNLYLDDESFCRQEYLYKIDYYDKFKNYEYRVMQDMIQLSLDSEELVDESLIEEYKKFLKSNDKISRDVFPNLIRYKPYTLPTIPEDDELEYLRLALIAQNEIAQKLRDNRSKKLGFRSLALGMKAKIPLLIINKDESIQWSETSLPEFLPKEEELTLEMDSKYDTLLEEVKNLEPKYYDIAILHALPYFTETTSGEEKMPFGLTIFSEYGTQFPTILPPVEELTEENLKILLVDLAQQIIQDGSKPQHIKTVDSKTYKILQDFCEKTSIELTKTENNTTLKARILRFVEFDPLIELYQAESQEEIYQILLKFL